jgi:integrase
LRVVGEPPRPPRRQRNIDRRPRDYLTPAEVETLMTTARSRSRYGHRDATMILIAYRHGLRVSELCRLEWSQIDFASGLLHVVWLKGSISTTHPLRGVELSTVVSLSFLGDWGRPPDTTPNSIALRWRSKPTKDVAQPYGLLRERSGSGISPNSQYVSLDLSAGAA